MKRVLLGMMVSGLILTLLAGTASATILLSEDFETGFTDGISVNGINGWTSGAPTNLGVSVKPNYPISVPLLSGSLVVARPLDWGLWGRATKNLSATPTEAVIETSSYFTFNNQDANSGGGTAELWLKKGTGSGTQYMSAAYAKNGSKSFTVGYENASGQWEMPGELPSFSVPFDKAKWYQMKMTLNTATKAMSWDYRGQDGLGGWTAWTNVTTFTGGSVAMFTPGKLSIGLIGSASSDGLPLMDNLQVQDIPEKMLVVTPDSRSVSSASGTTTFEVQNVGTGSGMGWTAEVTGGGSWLSIFSGGSGTDNGTITLNLTENTNTENGRTGTVRVTALGVEGSPKDVTVVQSKRGTTLTLLYEDFESGFTENTSVNGINGWTDTSVSPQAVVTSTATGMETFVPQLPDSSFVGRALNSGYWASATKNLSGTPTEPTIETSAYFTFNQFNGNTVAVELWLKGATNGSMQYMSPGRNPEKTGMHFTIGYKNASGTSETGLPTYLASLDNTSWYQMKMTLNTVTKAMSWDYRGQDGSGGWTAWTNVATFTGTGTMFTPVKTDIGIYFTDGNNNRPMVDNFLVLNIPDNPPPPAAMPTFSPEGGAYAVSQNVELSSITPNAIIRYTTDGSYPLDNGTQYTTPITVNDNLTIKARAWAPGYDPSVVNSNIYIITAGPYRRPASIPQGTVTVDGDLADWAGALWAPLDTVYNSTYPFDIDEAWYSAKWSADGSKVYIAVKVFDTDHKFTDTPYPGWNDQDGVELYIHTTGPGPVDYSLTQADAQQYSVRIKNGNRSQVWSVLRDNVSIPTQAGFDAAGREDGDWLYYEAALTSFKVFSLSGVGMTPSELSANQLIGLDVVVVGHDASTYTGSLAENDMVDKYKNYTMFGLHKLVVYTTVDLAAVLAAMDTKTNELNWNGDVDYDGDGEITSTDLSYVLSNMQ
ncbi:MAG: chitobiase/beta-hexosaminidase C-terminal domain-containing protein [Phycisphaerae bacterium]